MEFLAEYGIVVAITWLAFWQKNAFLYIMAFLADFFFGLALAADSTVASTQWVLGVIVAIIGIFCLFRVVVNELLPMVRRGK